MKPVAINGAEAIIEPFWDPELREVHDWVIEKNEKTGTKLIDWWCSFNFEWQNCAEDDVVLSMSRTYTPAISIDRYDTLMLSAMVPNGYRLRIQAETDAGCYSMESKPFGQEKLELFLPLTGALLTSIRLEVVGGSSENGMGWFNWVGLQSSKRLPDYLAQFRDYDPAWKESLYPADTPVDFKPHHGIFFSEEQLEQIRTLYQQKRQEGVPSPFAPNESYDKYFEPERAINDFVNFWDDTRYCRMRDNNNYLIRNGIRAALYGALEKDSASLHLAARYAMSILSCTHWDDGMICDFPAGSWEHRCFVQSLCLYDLVFIYDLAHAYFTPAGKSRLFRRIAEEGLASINFNSWRHEYIFHNNQLIWFSHGRMAAYSLLVKEWPRAARYMDIAYDDVVENIQNTVLSDGGYVEGPTYFNCVGQNGGQALHLYARAKNRSIEELTPKNLQASVNFADALLSTDRAQDMIPICDARGELPQSHLAFMAYLLKDSKWVDIFEKSIGRVGGLGEDYFALLVQSMNLKATAKTRSYVNMPEMNLVASHRFYNGKDVKMLVLGNLSGAGHTHEDKGSFVLEYGGQTFAMDVGTCDYSSSYSMVYKYCQRHNVLVPVGSKERVAAENPCMTTIPVVGSGDETAFHATVQAGKAYPRYYENWERRIDSDTPASFTIVDSYSLRADCGCDRVEFLWNTRLPVERQGDCVFILGDNGTVVLHIPENTVCEIRVLEMYQEEHQNQIAFVAKGSAGVIKTIVELRE